MKVKELQKMLEGCDPEAEVIRTSDNYELQGAQVKATSVTTYENGKKVDKSFMDAFSEKVTIEEVYDIAGGNLKMITID